MSVPPEWPALPPTAARAAEHRKADGVHIELRAHNALSPVGARRFMLSVAVGPLLTGGFCAFNGFWPVLPFAGLELLAVWLALRWSLQQGERRECIVITQDHVMIQAQVGAAHINTRFSRHWATVKLRAPPASQHPARLVIESKGESCEVGCFLTDDERRALAARLKQLVGNMNDSPRLDVGA